MLQQLPLVLVQLQPAGKLRVTLDELRRAEAGGYAEPVGMILNEMDDRVDAAVDRRIVRAEVRHSGQRLFPRGVDHAVDKLGHALALHGADGHDRYADETAELLHIDRAAVCVDLVHHVERDDRRHTQFEKLERKVEVALDIRRVDYIDDAVGLLVDDEVARNYLLLRIRAQGVYARQVDHRAVLHSLYLAGLLFDCDAGEIADVLVRAGQGIEERGLAAVLVSDKRKDHFEPTSRTSIFFASSMRSVSS